MEELCRALQHPDGVVRTTAALELARTGDASAVGALVEALRYATGGPVTVWIASSATVVLICLAILMLLGQIESNLVRHTPGFTWLGLLAAGGWALRWNAERLRLGRLRASLAFALASIAERDPSAEARAALPDLRALSADAVRQDWKARRACQLAVERIEAATLGLKDLPVVANPPAEVADNLPRPAAPAETGTGELPRVRG